MPRSWGARSPCVYAKRRRWSYSEKVCGVTTVVDVDVGDSPDTNAADSRQGCWRIPNNVLNAMKSHQSRDTAPGTSTPLVGRQRRSSLIELSSALGAFLTPPTPVVLRVAPRLLPCALWPPSFPDLHRRLIDTGTGIRQHWVDQGLDDSRTRHFECNRASSALELLHHWLPCDCRAQTLS